MKRLEAPIVKQTILKEVKLAHPRQMVIYPTVKRTIDLIFVLFMFPIALPVLIIFAIIIKFETTGPAFYIQERSGHQGKCFQLYKLRSMGIDAEKNGAVWAIANDPRVTKIGKFIRKTRIDELPQLLNVLKGEMSVVGPRPERPSFTEEFEQDIPGFKNRLIVKPGITGWAQVNGGYDISPEEKLDYDIYYINHQGIKLDVKIYYQTVKVIFTGNGAR